MSEWITDRLPTREDAHVDLSVWVCIEGGVLLWSYDGISLGTPWQPIGKPAPYVKPKRWTVKKFYTKYRVTDGNVSYYFPDPCTEAQAQRICDTFNEVLP
jgi:hypothetical protein